MKVIKKSELENHGALSPEDFSNGAIININKPEGWTSFDVVKKIRNIIKVRKVGHAGTLDPFAEGVLLICTGGATKRVPELTGLEKEYVGDIELGKTTDTYDRTGTVVTEKRLPDLELAQIRRACNSFVGEIDQTPPMYSAIKMDGQRLYKLARKGITVERKPRRVRVSAIDLLDFKTPILSFKVTCSKGTYIRSLAHDLGEKLGCGAYLKKLVRTRVGPYKLEDANSISEFEQKYATI